MYLIVQWPMVTVAVIHNRTRLDTLPRQLVVAGKRVAERGMRASWWTHSAKGYIPFRNLCGEKKKLTAAAHFFALRVRLSKHQELIGLLAAEITPPLPRIPMDLDVLGGEVGIDLVGHDEVVRVHGCCIAHCERPILEGTSKRLPDTTDNQRFAGWNGGMSILDALKMVLLHSLGLIAIQASNERLDRRRRSI